MEGIAQYLQIHHAQHSNFVELTPRVLNQCISYHKDGARDWSRESGPDSPISSLPAP